MAEFIFLMHDDSEGVHDWTAYLDGLRARGCFEGGSAIGDGACFRKSGDCLPVTAHIGGYIRITAADLSEARTLLAGNPVYESGGTVEIRELPRT